MRGVVILPFVMVGSLKQFNCSYSNLKHCDLDSYSLNILFLIKIGRLITQDFISKTFARYVDKLDRSCTVASSDQLDAVEYRQEQHYNIATCI